MDSASIIEQVYHSNSINRSICILKDSAGLHLMKVLLDAHLYTTRILDENETLVNFHEVGLCLESDQLLSTYIKSNEECDTIFCINRHAMLAVLKCGTAGKSIHQLLN